MAAKQTVGLGQEFQLSPGQTASVTGQSLSIEFVRITDDSRCPTGVTWVWAGQAVCLLKITSEGSVTEMSLNQMGSNDQSAQDYLGYHFAFDLHPYPEAGKDIHPEDYRLVLKVTRTAWKLAPAWSNLLAWITL
jgi:hypothetical protein